MNEHICANGRMTWTKGFLTLCLAAGLSLSAAGCDPATPGSNSSAPQKQASGDAPKNDGLADMPKAPAPRANTEADEKLLDAAIGNRPAEVKELIAAGTDVNAGLREGRTALMWASMQGHLDVVKALIEAKAAKPTRATRRR